MVYPGGRSSIRMERLVEGIQDFEKIRILRSRFEARGDKTRLEKLDKAAESFTSKNFDPATSTQALADARNVLYNLSR